MSTKTLTLLILGLILLVPIIFNSFNLTSTTTNSDNNTNKGYKLSSFNVSDPISITSDSNFATQAIKYGWSGNGSASKPYIIENLQIVNGTNNTYGISIDGIGITKHFIIRNNYIEMTGSGSIGIYLHYINSLGTIYNNTLNNNTVYGLELFSSSGNTVSNNVISYSGSYAFYSYSSSSTTLEYNTFTYNKAAAIRFFGSSSYNVVQHNIMSYNDEGVFYSSSNNDFIYNNTFSHNLNYAIHTGGPLSYTNITDNVISYSGNSIMYFQSSTTYVQFSGNIFKHNGAGGVRFAAAGTNNTILNNLFLNNSYGLNEAIGKVKVYNNTFQGNGYGIRLIGGTYGDYENNTFINNNYGFQVSSNSNYNYIFNNTFKTNSRAIDVVFGDNNTFVDNNIINNVNGIVITFADNNTFYGNNLLHNTVQATASYNTNKFDNGVIGNFWLDYVINAVDVNKDGIGDTAYPVSNVFDNLPLMVWHNEKLPLEFLKTNNNVTYSEGNAINYTWKLVDESPDTYMIYENNSVVQSGVWMSFLSDEYINTFLPQSLGLYNYTIVVNDTDGNIVSDTVFVNVIDVIPPNITGLTLYSYNETTPNHFVMWNVTDNHPDYYIVYKDGAVIDGNTWTANSTITIDVSGLLKNTYNYTIVANDTSNNIQTFTTIVDVYDGTPPHVTDYGNQTIESGSTGVSLNWTATDSYPAYYEIYNNSVLIANNTWTSNVNISQLINTFYLGEYNFSIIVYDDSGNNITSTIFITFVDTTNPVITSYPSNNTIDVSYSGNTISWSAMDFYPSHYVLLDNNSNFMSGSWITDTVNFNLDSLTVGLHNLTIYFNDTSGNSVISTVWITVITDTVPPTITVKPFTTVFQDIQSSKSVSWTVIDDKHPANYTLYINGTAYSSGNWLNNTAIVLQFSGLLAGIYNFTIVFNDTLGNSAFDTVWITIFTDTKAPQLLSSPMNSTFTDVSTGNNFSWQIIDDVGSDQYMVYVDGVVFASGTWTNNSMITKNMDSLIAGIHHIEAYFNDTSNNTVYTDFWITVISTDVTPPVVTAQPSTTVFQDISSTSTVSWTATDNFGPNKYSLYINNSVYSTGAWTNNTATVIPFNGFMVGNYNFTIVFNDTAGNVVNDTVWITIFTDTTVPQILTTPFNTTYADVSTENNFTWLVIDDYGSDQFIVYVDGVSYATGSWTNNSLVTETIDGLSVGVHFIEAYFNDTSNNTVYSNFWIDVTYTDNTAPVITTHPSTTVFLDTNSNNNVSWTVIDENGPNMYSFYINETFNSSGLWQNNTALMFQLDGLPAGLYNLTITFNDTAGNTVIETVWISIGSDQIAPIITGITNLTFDQGSTGNTVSVTASDSSPATYEIYQNQSLIQTGSWTSDQPISVNLDPLLLEPGVYSIIFVITDSSNNTAYHTVIVTVQAPGPTTTTPPPATKTPPVSSTTTSKSSSNSGSTTSRTTITQDLPSNWNLLFLFLSLSSIVWFRSKRK